MILSNTLSIYLLHHNKNKICDQNLHLIKDAMHFRRFNRLKMQACLYKLPKSRITHQDRHTWRNPVNGRVRVSWEQVPW